jgi:hypothetical protein
VTIDELRFLLLEVVEPFRGREFTPELESQIKYALIVTLDAAMPEVDWSQISWRFTRDKEGGRIIIDIYDPALGPLQP